MALFPLRSSGRVLDVGCSVYGSAVTYSDLPLKFLALTANVSGVGFRTTLARQTQTSAGHPVRADTAVRPYAEDFHRKPPRSFNASNRPPRTIGQIPRLFHREMQLKRFPCRGGPSCPPVVTMTLPCSDFQSKPQDQSLSLTKDSRITLAGTTTSWRFRNKINVCSTRRPNVKELRVGADRRVRPWLR